MLSLCVLLGPHPMYIQEQINLTVHFIAIMNTITGTQLWLFDYYQFGRLFTVSADLYLLTYMCGHII